MMKEARFWLLRVEFRLGVLVVLWTLHGFFPFPSPLPALLGAALCAAVGDWIRLVSPRIKRAPRKD